MRKGKVVIKWIAERIKRQVTFWKRRKSLMKKARELSILCDVQIGVIIFSESDKIFNFCSHSTSMENLIMRYQMEKSHATADYSFQPDHGSNCGEMKESMMIEINNLKQNLQLYEGHGLNLLTYDDLLRFELEHESALQNVRARKVELMEQEQQQQLKGKGKEKLVDEDTQQFYHPGEGSSWEHLMWQAEKQMMTCQRKEPTGVPQFLPNLMPSSSSSPNPGPN